MSITVKVQLKEKTFKLTQGVNTITQVNQEMKLRFPNRKIHFQYIFENKPALNLQTLIQEQRGLGKNSIKLTAQLVEDDRSNQMNSSLISLNSSEEPIVLQEEESEVKLEQKVEPTLIPEQFYVCYNCLGKKIIQEGFITHLCDVCQGKGKFENTHKIIKHLANILKGYSLIKAPQEMKSQIKPEETIVNVRKSSWSRVDKTCSVMIHQLDRKDKMQVDTPFNWKFSITNTGECWPSVVQIIDCETNEHIPFKSLTKRQETIFEVGPFTCLDQRILQKTYCLCYKEGDEWVRFGYKFGFTVKGIKKIEVREFKKSPRQILRTIKMMSGSKKAQDYLNIRLLAMGIDVTNSCVDDQTLIEIVKQIN